MQTKRDLSNITVNGIPLTVIVDDQINEEIQTHHATEVRELNFVKRIHIPTSVLRNHSGSRSGRGRIILSRSMQAGGVL